MLLFIDVIYLDNFSPAFDHLLNFSQLSIESRELVDLLLIFTKNFDVVSWRWHFSSSQSEIKCLNSMAQLLSLYQWQSKSNNLGQSKSYQLSEKDLIYSFLQQKNDDAFRESWEEIHFNIIDVRWRFFDRGTHEQDKKLNQPRK
jgi:hypothetical protein